jgi:hypothetical protein
MKRSVNYHNSLGEGGGSVIVVVIFMVEVVFESSVLPGKIEIFTI